MICVALLLWLFLIAVTVWFGLSIPGAFVSLLGDSHDIIECPLGDGLSLGLFEFQVLIWYQVSQLLILLLVDWYLCLQLIDYWLVFIFFLSQECYVFKQWSVFLDNLIQPLITQLQRFAHGLKPSKELIFIVDLRVERPFKLDVKFLAGSRVILEAILHVD